MNGIKAAATGVLVTVMATGLAATSASARELRVSVDTFKDGEMIPNKYAFCVPAAQGHTAPGPNFSPSISWSRGPRGTKSYVIMLYDTDSPAEQRDKINKGGVTMTPAIPRRTFFHWVLVDSPPHIRSLEEGADSDARVVHGKPAAPAAAGVRGLNDYTKVSAGNDAMQGQYHGYDGPCPPWNDEVVHHYHFAVFALSVKSLDLPPGFDGGAVLEVMKDKVLAQGEVVGLYTQNPAKGAKVSN
jgi:Raf kinase inhibitor-like YbhB/YbcL family protein